MSTKISNLEAICLVLIITINEIIVDTPNNIILNVGSSSIINIIYVSILAIIFAVILCKLLKNFSSKDILDISEYVGGKFLKVIVGILFLVFFILILSLACRYLSNSLKIIYFSRTPLCFLLLFLLLPAIISNNIGQKSIFEINLIITLVATISLSILFIPSYTYINFYKFLPVFGNGLNETFLKGCTNVFAFTGFAYLYFIPPFLEKTSNFKKITIVSTIISSIYLIFSVFSFLSSLASIAETDQIISFYLFTRIVELGNFLERVDAIFIFAWFFSLLSFISITLFFILNIIKKITKIKNTKPLSAPLGFIILGISLVFKNYSQVKYLENIVLKYGSISLIFIVGIVIFVLANLKYKRSNKDLI